MFHAFNIQNLLEQLVNSFNEAADGICNYSNEFCFFEAEQAVDTKSNDIDIIFYGFTTKDVLEQLVNCFIESLEGSAIETKKISVFLLQNRQLTHKAEVLTSCSMHFSTKGAGTARQLLH